MSGTEEHLSHQAEKRGNWQWRSQALSRGLPSSLSGTPSPALPAHSGVFIPLSGRV